MISRSLYTAAFLLVLPLVNANVIATPACTQGKELNSAKNVDACSLFALMMDWGSGVEFSNVSIPQLPASGSYSAESNPTLGATSKEYYTAMAACSWCQGDGRSWNTWAQWQSSWTSGYQAIEKYPYADKFANVTELPSWISSTGALTFDPNIALSAATISIAESSKLSIVLPGFLTASSQTTSSTSASSTNLTSTKVNISSSTDKSVSTTSSSISNSSTSSTSLSTSSSTSLSTSSAETSAETIVSDTAKSSKLSTGALIGIVVGVFIVIFIFVIGICFMRRKHAPGKGDKVKIDFDARQSAPYLIWKDEDKVPVTPSHQVYSHPRHAERQSRAYPQQNYVHTQAYTPPAPLNNHLHVQQEYALPQAPFRRTAAQDVSEHQKSNNLQVPHPHTGYLQPNAPRQGEAVNDDAYDGYLPATPLAEKERAPSVNTMNFPNPWG